MGRDGGERAHLVPLSIAWVDGRIVIALEARSVTARNLSATGAARLALGGTRDVVLIDTALEATHEVTHAPPELADAYAAQSDWDPRGRRGLRVPRAPTGSGAGLDGGPRARRAHDHALGGVGDVSRSTAPSEPRSAV